jgi:hypothetical protein
VPTGVQKFGMPAVELNANLNSPWVLEQLTAP